jgi:hypothetical protein
MQPQLERIPYADIDINWRPLGKVVNYPTLTFLLIGVMKRLGHIDTYNKEIKIQSQSYTNPEGYLFIKPREIKV